MLTWLPYSISSMYIAFVDEIGLGPMAETLPAMFAKSSMVWRTIYYLYTNEQFRSKISLKLFSRLQPSQPSMSEVNNSTQINLTFIKTYKSFENLKNF